MEINSQIIVVEVVRKRGLKHAYLKFLAPHKLQVRINYCFPITEVENLLEKKRIWIEKSQKQLLQTLDTKEYYFLGKRYERNSENIDEIYAKKAKELLPSLVQKHSAIMRLYPAKLSFRKNKTRLGSCSSKNAISLNILLLKYPLEVIEYVIIHELAHIKHKNHSKDFWGFVEKYCANYKQLDARLKEFSQPF